MVNAALSSDLVQPVRSRPGPPEPATNAATGTSTGTECAEGLSLEVDAGLAARLGDD